MMERAEIKRDGYGNPPGDFTVYSTAISSGGVAGDLGRRAHRSVFDLPVGLIRCGRNPPVFFIFPKKIYKIGCFSKEVIDLDDKDWAIFFYKMVR